MRNLIIVQEKHRLILHDAIITSIPRPYTDKIHEVLLVEVFNGYSKKTRSVIHSQFTIKRFQVNLENILGPKN